MKVLFAVVSLFAISVFFTSCEKEDPMDPNGEELITTLRYSLTSAAGDVVTLSFVDLDGDGGTEPTIVGGTLKANETYTGSLEMLSETGDTVEDISEEVLEEALEHQVFFTSSIADVSFDYLDQDTSGFPLGLASQLSTGAPATGTITIILRHEPTKDAVGVDQGDITNAGGETDIEVTFNIDVE